MIYVGCKKSRSDADDISSSRNLLILYATETGTAQDTADRIARECRRIHFTSRVLSMHAYQPHELISQSLVIFVVSTTGSGIEPRSMTLLWKRLLRSDLPNDLFDDLSFAVFGLGDTAYEKFCWPAKKLCRRMQGLGATEFCAIGEGDEQHPLGIDGALSPWITMLLDNLLRLHPLPHGINILPERTLPPPRVSMLNSISNISGDMTNRLEIIPDHFQAVVKCNRRITTDDWYQDVRHLEFAFSDDIFYDPGDVAVIHPEASSMEVETFLTSMGWGNHADDRFTIERQLLDQSFPDYLPKIASLRTLFTYHLDINAIPRRSFFQFLRHFVSDPVECEKLDEFISAEGAEELFEYCFRVKRTIREVLSEFRSARIPREYVFDLFPQMRPRLFSIASSIKMHPKEIHLCVAIVRYRTKLRIPRKGVCTTFLAALRTGDSLRIGIQKSLFNLPRSKTTPLICVGPGTGIAPVRAMIEDRIHQGIHANTLYFGCRSSAKDEHYRAEWSSYSSNDALVYRVAHSRDVPEGSKRIYVQDLILADCKRVWELVGEKGAWVFISGSSNKMPVAVKDAIRHAVEKEGGKTVDEAREFVAAMERDQKMIEECWS